VNLSDALRNEGRMSNSSRKVNAA